MIDYITELTKQEKILFVGHSMGTTQFLVSSSIKFIENLQLIAKLEFFFKIMGSEKPEYNDKIRAAFLLAPAALMKNAVNPIFLIAEWAGSVENLLHLLGVYEFLPHTEIINWLGDIICNEEEHPIYAEACVNIAFLILGIQTDQLNK